MSELEKTTYDRGFYNGIREARQIFAKHLNVSTSTDEIKWDNVSKTEILSEIDNFMMKNESYHKPQLTIPKSIADEADKYLRMDWEFWDINLDTGKCTDEFYEFINCEDNDQENSKLIIAYLAGKSLGVDLVKVVEG